MKKAFFIILIAIVVVLGVLLFYTSGRQKENAATNESNTASNSVPTEDNPQNATITVESISQTLSEVAVAPRRIGTEGASEAERYIADKLFAYGYDVQQQDFVFADAANLDPEQNSNSGVNMIATKKGAGESSDILIVSCHYDTVAGTVGANNGASGLALMLELAKAIAAEPSDTEIRFIAFSGKEDGLLGSSYYVNSLTDDDKAHIIGDIHLDLLGHYMSSGLKLYTADGKETLVGNLINQSAQNVASSALGTAVQSKNDHMSFAGGGIPAVLLAQNNVGVENNTVADNLSIIDCNKILSAADILLGTLQNVMSTDTENLSVQAYEISDMKNPSYVIGENTVFYFQEDKKLTDNQIGGQGKLVDEKNDEVLGHLEDYYYDAKWFGMNTALPTVMEYTERDSKRFLYSINIDFIKAGYSIEDMQEILLATYGEPIFVVPNSSYDGYEDYVWADVLHSLQYVLTWTGDNWMLQAAGGYSGGGTDIKQYDLTAGIEQYAGTDELHYKLLDFISRIAGSYISYIDTLNVWTDGLSYQLGAAYFSSDGDNRTFTVRMDINDIFDKDGNYRNAHKTLQTFVHEFGHVLTLNAAQVDLSKQPDDKFYYVYDSFKEGSYLKAFCDAFWKPLASDDGEELYKNNPSLFVDEYASTNSNEDIAESFMLFVLSNRPTGSSIAEAKIDFFYNYPELVQLRDQIRANFGYEK